MTETTSVRFAAIDAQYGLPVGTLDSVWQQESSRGANIGPSRSASGRLVGARGHFQFMPDTGAEIARRSHHDPFSANPEEAAQAAGFYIRQLRQQLHGDLGMALAAYNAGAGRVQDAVGERGGNWLDAMPAETRRYVPQILARLGVRQEQIDASWRYQQSHPDPQAAPNAQMTDDERRHAQEEREQEEARRRQTLQGLGMQENDVNAMGSQGIMGMLFFAIVIALIGRRTVEQAVPAPTVPSPTASAPAPTETDLPLAAPSAAPAPSQPPVAPASPPASPAPSGDRSAAAPTPIRYPVQNTTTNLPPGWTPAVARVAAAPALPTFA